MGRGELPKAVTAEDIRKRGPWGWGTGGRDERIPP